MNKYNVIQLNTGRNALRYIIRAFQIEEIYLPYYICPTIRNVALKENCKVIFYHIDKTFKPVYNFNKNDYILYPDYFGICGNIISDLVKKYPNLIIDNAHSFFSEPKGLASFSSLRKFFPCLRDGAFLYTTKTLDINIEKDNYNYEYKELSFEKLCKNENRLDKEPIKYMSDCTTNYFSKIDLEEEKRKFIEHFKLNSNKYNDLNNLKIKLSHNAVPYKYPFFADNIKNADNLVKELENNGKTIFRYWNNMPDIFIEKEFYTKLIAI